MTEKMWLVKGGPITAEQVAEGIHPAGTEGLPEWQLSDGPSGSRGYSCDFPSREAAEKYAAERGMTIVGTEE